MSWADFWALIGILDGKADEAGCRSLAAALSKRPVSDIQAFAERLAEALYRLDQEKAAVHERPLRTGWALRCPGRCRSPGGVEPLTAAPAQVAAAGITRSVGRAGGPGGEAGEFDA
ncbi:DUF4240 domain-containing protein [Streptomyces sp. NPDC003393]